MNDKRMNRIAEEIRKIVSKLISNELKDPRIFHMTTVTDVRVTRDLRYAKIYVSVLGNEENKKDTIEGLQNAKGFVRREFGSNLKLRYTPEPIFCLDESIEKGVYMSHLIDKVNEKDEKKRRSTHDR